MPSIDVKVGPNMRKIIYILLLIILAKPTLAQSENGRVYILGNLEPELKAIFKDSITSELYSYAQNISLQSQSQIYVFPYLNLNKDSWEVVTLHVEGKDHYAQLSDIDFQDQPLISLDQIREVVGLDGSLKFISWNTYSELPPEKIFLASKAIAQEYLFIHF